MSATGLVGVLYPVYDTRSRRTTVVDSSLDDFTSCGTDCLENACVNPKPSDDTIVQCVCHDPLALQNAFLCMWQARCPKSDSSQLSQDCNGGSIDASASASTLTLIPSPTLITKTITLLSSTVSERNTSPPPPIASICTTYADVSAPVQCSPAPHSDGTWDDNTTSVSASVPGSTTPASIQNDQGSHALSPKASIPLAVGLCVGILVVVCALLCLRHRQRQRHGASLGRLIVPNDIGNDNHGSTRMNDHQLVSMQEEFASVAGGRPSTGTSEPSLDRPISTIHICGAVLLSPSTDVPQTPTPVSHERTRPLSTPSGLGSHQADMAPSAQRESSSWYESMASTRAAVGGSAGSPPRTRPHAGPGDIEKTPTHRDGQHPGESRDGNQRPPPPGLPAPSALVPSDSSPLASARRTSTLRAPRFVTVLMEVDEEELEDRGEPPPYQRRLEPEEAQGSREAAEAY